MSQSITWRKSINALFPSAKTNGVILSTVAKKIISPGEETAGSAFFLPVPVQEGNTFAIKANGWVKGAATAKLKFFIQLAGEPIAESAVIKPTEGATEAPWELRAEIFVKQVKGTTEGVLLTTGIITGLIEGTETAGASVHPIVGGGAGKTKTFEKAGLNLTTSKALNIAAEWTTAAGEIQQMAPWIVEEVV